MLTVPHIVLVLGPHVVGAERAMEHVIKQENPNAVLAENFIDKIDVESTLRRLATPPTLAQKLARKKPIESFQRKLYVLAKKYNLPFGFSEEHDIGFTGYYHSNESDAYLLEEKVNKLSGEGKIDEAIICQQRANDILREIDLKREKVIAETHIATANKHNKLVSFIGNAHTNLIKLLREGGARVTVYRVPTYKQNGPVLCTSYRKSPRTPILREIFFGHVVRLCYLNLYKLTEKEYPFIHQIIPSIANLRRMPAGEIENFFRKSEGMSEDAFKQHLFEFMKSRGVKMPPYNEMLSLAQKIEYPIPRKVKTLEPIKR